MKIESTQFTESDIDSFITDYFDHERHNLIGRLRKVVSDIEAIIPKIEARSPGEEQEWSAVETLAHMATSAQFFGYLTHEIVTKKEIAIDILEMLKLRDVATSEAAQQSAAELADQLGNNLEKTIALIEQTSVDDLRNSIKYVTREMSAEDIVRIPLCGHLETHVDQLRKAVTG